MIQDENRLYNFLSPLVQFGTRCHYNRFDVHGMENLPTDGAYIIAPCHQQALMEPLAVLCFSPKPPVFLARADIFAKPMIRAILTFLKILPVYRIRDGQENLSKNNDIFDHSRDVLLDGYPLCLMAEGRHNDRHHLLNFGKGMFRIAGETQQKLGDHPLFIVPTGIDFDEYERPYSNLVVNIGKPIPVQPFMKTYCSNEPVALNQMRDSLKKALLSQMHDIRDEEHYDEIMTLCNVANKEMRRREGLENSAWNRFRMRQKIAWRIEALAREEDKTQFTKFIAKSETLRKRLKALRLNEKVAAEHRNLPVTLLSLLLVVAFAVAFVVVPAVRWISLFCLVCFPLPFLPTHLIVKKLIADSQFRSSVNFGIRFFFCILYTIVIGIVMACCGGAWMSRLADLGAWWGLIAVGLVHIEAPIAGPLINFLKGVISNSRYWLMRLFRSKAMREVDAVIREIGAEI